MSPAHLTPAQHEALSQFLEESRGNGSSHFEKALRLFTVDHGLEAIFPTSNNQVFRKRAHAVLRCQTRHWHQALRLAQLLDGDYRFWVYRTDGCERHDEFDQITLPADHNFWSSHFPANGWHCRCTVYGARNEAGISRVGGDLEKLLPRHWNHQDHVTGMLYGIEQPFLGQVHPSLEACIEALMSGRYPDF